MSETKLATKADLQEMYQRILPYLGGSADAGFTPIGTIIAVMGKNAPANYLPCDGRVVNISDYPELANYFKEQFGSSNYFGGDGTTTFGIVDLSGEFLRGTGTNSHENQGNGAAVGVHQDGTLIPETYSNGSKINVSTLNGESHYKNNDSYIKNSDGAKARAIINSSSFDEWGYNDTSRPTNTSVLYCIATKNIYLNPSLDYSTDEKVVGTWIDGKTLYQKTIVDTLPTTVDTTKYVSINSLVDKIVFIEAITEATDGTFLKLDTPNNGMQYVTKCFAISNDNNTANKNKIGLYTSFADRLGDSVYITIQYTKTTD